MSNISRVRPGIELHSLPSCRVCFFLQFCIIGVEIHKAIKEDALTAHGDLCFRVHDAVNYLIPAVKFCGLPHCLATILPEIRGRCLYALFDHVCRFTVGSDHMHVVLEYVIQHNGHGVGISQAGFFVVFGPVNFTDQSFMLQKVVQIGLDTVEKVFHQRLQ